MSICSYSGVLLWCMYVRICTCVLRARLVLHVQLLLALLFSVADAQMQERGTLPKSRNSQPQWVISLLFVCMML